MSKLHNRLCSLEIRFCYLWFGGTFEIEIRIPSERGREREIWRERGREGEMDTQIA